MKIIKKAKTGAIVLATFLFSLTTFATTHTVTSATDNTSGSLRALVDSSAAGDTIIFDASTNGVLQLLLTGEITIDKALYIIGNGPANTVLDGNAMGRIFQVTDADSLHIEEITFTNGYSASSGGAIAIYNTDVTISNCHLNFNEAAGIAATEGGGALYNYGGRLTIEGTQLIENSATGTSGSGGGILNDSAGTLTISASLIAANIANRSGGGIEDRSFSSTAVTLTNVTLNANSTGENPGNGGGLHVTGNGNVNLINGTVNFNTAARQGGGLWNGTGTMTISGTQIITNTANGKSSGDGGGGIFNNGGTLNLSNNTQVSFNSAPDSLGSGGGIFNNTAGEVTVQSSQINSNQASRAGGGIEDQSGAGGGVSLTNTEVNANSTGPMPGNGGGVHITGVGSITLTGGTVNLNTAASEGGGLWNGSGTMTIVSTKIDLNTAHGDEPTQGGGGIYNLNGTVNISNNTEVTNNIADGISGSGGGIFNDSTGTLLITDSEISGNTANRAGGGIEDRSFATAPTSIGTELINSSISGNYALNNPGSGAGLHVSGNGNIRLQNSVVDGNTAAHNGGGLWNGTGNMMVLHSSIKGNVAHGDGGGGIWNNGGTLSVNSSTFSDNAVNGTAGAGGGIYNANGTTDVSYSTFSANYVQGTAGAIYNVGTLDLLATTITNNYAALNGGGVAQGIAVANATTFRSTVVAQNFSSGAAKDLISSSGIFISNGYNLIGEDDADDFPAQPTDIEGTAGNPVDAMLEALADNGGSAQTHALMCGSPAINAGDPGLDSADQRGEPVYGPTRDIGSFELQQSCDHGDSLSLVSDSSWRKSTEITFTNYSGTWNGANGTLPATATFTDNVEIGQPYGYPSINLVEGTEVIKTGNNITYFRKEFNLNSTDWAVRIRTNVDDQCDVYINGHQVALISTFGRMNYKNSPHDALLVSGSNTNGFDGGDAYSYLSAANLDTILIIGSNEIVVAVRNLGTASDKGGFSFRLDFTKDAPFSTLKSAVASVSEELRIYPNPTSGQFSVNIPFNADVWSHEVILFDINGRMLSHEEVEVNNWSMDLSGYTSGVYFLKIKTGDKVITEKVVKN